MPWLLRQQSYRVCSLHMASGTTTELLLVKFPSSALGADYHTGPGAHLKLKTRVQQAFYLGSIQHHCRGEKRGQALTMHGHKDPSFPFIASSPLWNFVFSPNTTWYCDNQFLPSLSSFLYSYSSLGLTKMQAGGQISL